jgi:cytochrome c5
VSCPAAARRAVFVACLMTALACSCRTPLPEAESAGAKLYEARCGTCHYPHLPRALTPAMWKVQVERMDQKFRDARMQPPTAQEKERILAYLTRHAGG